jgi:CRISPR-associated protein Csy1
MTYQTPSLPPEAKEIRDMVYSFINERLQLKLEKLEPDDPNIPKLKADHDPGVWLLDAAKRATQLKAVTHSVKPMHSDAKGSSVHAPSKVEVTSAYVNTGCLSNYDLDVVGNAAALDVFKLLKRTVREVTVLQMAINGEPALHSALSDDPAIGEQIASAFATLTQAPARLATHSLAKQVYWPISSNVCDDQQFILLSPLYPTALMHTVFKTIQSDRFSDNAKAAREARKKGDASDDTIKEYVGLAVIELGGSKPQNISQLNSERGGRSYMLASLPPSWESKSLRPILNQESMFSAFGRQRGVAKIIFEFRRFIKSQPPPIFETREAVSRYVEELVSLFMNFTGEMRQLDDGWSLDLNCKLSLEEKVWLDTEAVMRELESTKIKLTQNVPEQICSKFALWLNDRLNTKEFPMGDDQSNQWARYLRTALDAELHESLNEEELVL